MPDPLLDSSSTNPVQADHPAHGQGLPNDNPSPVQFPARRFRKKSSGQSGHGKADRTNSGKAEKFLINKLLPLIGLALILGAVLTAIYSSDGAMAKIRLILASLFQSSDSVATSSGVLAWSIPRLSILLPPALGSLFIVFQIIITRRTPSLYLKSINLLIWFILACWWNVAFYYTNNALMFYGFIGLSTGVYITFQKQLIQIKIFNQSRYLRRLEYSLIVLNFGLYFGGMLLMVGGTFGPYFFMLPFTIVLGVFQIYTVVSALRKESDFNPAPHLLVAGFLVSLILPLLFYPPLRLRNILDFLPLLIICFSGFLAFYARRMRSPLAIGVSLLLMIPSQLFYFYQWVLQFYSNHLVAGSVFAWTSFFHITINGSILIAALLFVHHYYSRTDNVLPKFGYERGNYLKLFMGCALITIFMTGFLFVYHFLPQQLKLGNSVLPVCSTFMSLYCSVALFSLALRKSWFLKFILLASTLLLTVHLILTYLQAISMREDYIRAGVIFRPALYLHISMIALFLALVASVASKVKTVFVHIIHVQFYYFYLPLLLTAMALIEYDQFMSLAGRPESNAMDTTLVTAHLFPWSSIIIVCSLLYLIMGFIFKLSLLRILSLLLLFMAIFKIIFYDVSDLTASSKSLCMLALGAGTLLVSILYPKIRSHFVRVAARRR